MLMENPIQWTGLRLFGHQSLDSDSSPYLWRPQSAQNGWLGYIDSSQTSLSYYSRLFSSTCPERYHQIEICSCNPNISVVPVEQVGIASFAHPNGTYGALKRIKCLHFLHFHTSFIPQPISYFRLMRLNINSIVATVFAGLSLQPVVAGNDLTPRAASILISELTLFVCCVFHWLTV